LESVLSQTVVCEAIVVLDRPSEKANVEHLLGGLEYKLLISQSKGASFARNLGVTSATTELVAFLDDDDYWRESKIEMQLRDHIPGQAFVSTCATSFRRSNGKLSRKTAKRFSPEVELMQDYLVKRHGLKFGSVFFCTSTLVISKNLAAKVPWDDSLPKHQDWDLFIRLSEVPSLVIHQVTQELVVVQQGSRESISSTIGVKKSLPFFEKHGTKISQKPSTDFILLHLYLPWLLVSPKEGKFSNLPKLRSAPNLVVTVRFLVGLVRHIGLRKIAFPEVASRIDSSSSAVFSLVVGRAVSALSQAVLLLWISSLSSPESLNFALVWFTAGLLLAGLTDFGFTNLITKTGKTDFQQARRYLGISTTISMIILAIIGAGATALSFFGIDTYLVVAGAVLLSWGVVENITESINMLQVTQNKANIAGFSMGLRRILALALFPLLVIQLGPIMAFALSVFLGSSLTLLIGMKNFTISISATKGLLRLLAPLATFSLLNQARNLESILVANLYPVRDSAAFSLGTRLSNPLTIVGGSMGNVILARENLVSEAKLNRWTLIFALSAFSVVAVGVLVQDQALISISAILPWFTQTYFLVLIFILARSVLFAWVTIQYSLLIAIDQDRLAAIIQTIFTVASLALLSVMGIAGAPINYLMLTLMTLALVQAFVYDQVLRRTSKW
jgi:glycosyltransferase involved in cell wall biosynthesis/O-antigen/teichoic acid export membrane protein